MKQYESFSHGLVISKIWLCEQLEKVLIDRPAPTLNVLGCWDNLLAFMLIVRKPNFYKEINGYDLSHDSINAANEICDTWLFETPRVYNHVVDVNTVKFTDNTQVFINCSVDQFTSNEWYDNIPIGSTICIQSTDMPINNELWEITQSIESLDDLTNRYKMSTILYSGKHLVDYVEWSYNRYMIIGIK